MRMSASIVGAILEKRLRLTALLCIGVRRVSKHVVAHHGPTMPLAIRVAYSSDKPSGSWPFVRCVE
jgi:hypothetical protein